MADTAILSNQGEFTSFSFEECTIRFRTPKTLEKYVKILEWDEGYLVVLAKYSNKKETQEEYIDLVPILENLYFDPKTFLKPIKKVRIANGSEIEGDS